MYISRGCDGRHRNRKEGTQEEQIKLKKIIRVGDIEKNKKTEQRSNCYLKIVAVVSVSAALLTSFAAGLGLGLFLRNRNDFNLTRVTGATDLNATITATTIANGLSNYTSGTFTAPSAPTYMVTEKDVKQGEGWLNTASQGSSRKPEDTTSQSSSRKPEDTTSQGSSRKPKFSTLSTESLATAFDVRKCDKDEFLIGSNKLSVAKDKAKEKYKRYVSRIHARIDRKNKSSQMEIIIMNTVDAILSMNRKVLTKDDAISLLGELVVLVESKDEFYYFYQCNDVFLTMAKVHNAGQFTAEDTQCFMLALLNSVTENGSNIDIIKAQIRNILSRSS